MVEDECAPEAVTAMQCIAMALLHVSGLPARHYVWHSNCITGSQRIQFKVDCSMLTANLFLWNAAYRQAYGLSSTAQRRIYFVGNLASNIRLT